MSTELIENRFKIKEITNWKYYPKLFSIYDKKYDINFISSKLHKPNSYFIPIREDTTYESLKNLKIKKDENLISLSFSQKSFWCLYVTMIMNEYLRKYLTEYKLKVPWEDRHNYGKLNEIDYCILTNKDIDKLLLLPDDSKIILVVESKELFRLNQTIREGRIILESEKEKHMNKMENRYNLIIANLYEDYNKIFKKEF